MHHRTKPPALRRKLLSQAVLLALCAAPVAHAQDASTDLGTVQAGAQGASAAKGAAAKKLAQRQVFRSGQAVKVIGHAELKAVGPFGGAAQAIAFAPGAQVTSFGATGATKSSISINGFKQGWGGFSGASGVDNGDLSVTFDGVPMVNPSSGLWSTSQIPEMSLISGVGITYGPGEPVDRWYNNLGGQIDFLPVQPSNKAGGSIGFSVGSNSARGLHYLFNTGKHDGWATVLAGGTSSSDSYRTAADGFNSRSQDYAVFLKTRKDFEAGDFSIGLYQARGTGFRPMAVPTTAVPDVTLTGTAGSPVYSQQTSGFYSTVPGYIWHKNDTNKTRLIYGKLNVALDAMTTLHNLAWYRLGERVHDHYYNYGLSSPANMYEHNNPRTTVYGDRMWADIALPRNLVSVGGFFLKSTYNTRNAFFNPADLVGTSTTVYGSQYVPNAKYRSDYFDQTDVALFAQDRISALPNLDITPGVRLIDYSTIYSPAGATDFATAYQLDPSKDQGSLPGSQTSHHDVEPSISLNYRPTPWLATFANYAVAYKEPQVGGGGGLYQSVQPVYNLEKNNGYNLGFKIHVARAEYLRNFLLSVSYFHNHFANQYITFTNPVTGNVSDANGDSTYKGVNIAVADDVLYNLGVFANLNFEKADFNSYTTGGISYANLPVSYVPNRTFNFGVDYRIYRDGVLWNPALTYQYTGEQSMWSDAANSQSGGPSTQKMPAYGVWNLSLDATKPLHDTFFRRLHLSLGVLNALDKQYNANEFVSYDGEWVGTGATSTQFVMAIPGAPRTFYAGLSADF